MGQQVATHRFVGQVVSVHLLCASHDGEVEVALVVDGEQHLAFTNACTTPQFTVEDDGIAAGPHEVGLRVSPRGASGVVYLTEGEI